MKTFKYLFGLLLILAFSQVSAQVPEYPEFPPPPDNPVVEGTKTVVWDGHWVIADDVVYNGELIDRIYGPITWHNVYHYKDGVFVHGTSTAKGEIVSLVTGERFRVNEQDKMNVEGPTPGGTWYFHNNLKGDKGSHYITSGYGDMITLFTIFTKVVIPGKKK